MSYKCDERFMDGKLVILPVVLSTPGPAANENFQSRSQAIVGDGHGFSPSLVFAVAALVVFF